MLSYGACAQRKEPGGRHIIPAYHWGYETRPEATVVEWVEEEAFHTKEVMNNITPESGGESGGGGSLEPCYQDVKDFLRTGTLPRDPPIANKI
ncbi:hypothetical protein LIER_37337 [Lithospermum erythrorhizon]|uniref:Uncharacterized protein n=1 Tax=Lithospermum erythrorhizon TaxID=34254 RepID=A0AAV3PK86_LITER